MTIVDDLRIATQELVDAISDREDIMSRMGTAAEAGHTPDAALVAGFEKSGETLMQKTKQFRDVTTRIQKLLGSDDN